MTRPAMPSDAASACKLRQLRAFAGDVQRGLRKRTREFRKGAQRRREAFLRNQAAGLHAAPGAVERSVALLKGNLGERDAGAVQADLARIRPDSGEPLRERLGAHEQQRGAIEHAAREREVGGFVEVDPRIRPVKADDHRHRRNLQQRQADARPYGRSRRAAPGRESPAGGARYGALPSDKS
ncbi:MAG: hypothetical protein WDN28_18035 [Chthoniobacter sp.]